MMLLEGKQGSVAVDLRFALHCQSQHYADLPPRLLLRKKVTALISVYTISVESSVHFVKDLCMLTRKIQTAFTWVFFNNMIICKSNITLALIKECTVKVAVKQLHVVVRATRNATFALCGQQKLLEIRREK